MAGQTGTETAQLQPQEDATYQYKVQQAVERLKAAGATDDEIRAHIKAIPRPKTPNQQSFEDFATSIMKQMQQNRQQQQQQRLQMQGTPSGPPPAPQPQMMPGGRRSESPFQGGPFAQQGLPSILAKMATARQMNRGG